MERVLRIDSSQGQEPVLTHEIAMPYWSAPERREPSEASVSLSFETSDAVIVYVPKDPMAACHVPPRVRLDDMADHVPSEFTTTVLGTISNQRQVPTNP